MATRTTFVAAFLTAGVMLTGCTGSGSPGTHSSATTPAAGARTTSGSTQGQAAKPSTRTPNNPRAALPVVKPATISGISYGTATATDRKRFARVSKASGGLLTSSAVHQVLVAGNDVGTVAVYRTKPGLAKSTTFQDQYVVQLINAVVGHSTRPRFVRADGQVMALSSGATAVAGWFEGDTVVLVYRQGKAPDLVGLATGVRSTPTGR